MDPIEQFTGLKAVVQYRGKKDGVSPLHWLAMAAFDSRDRADTYCADCASGDLPWEYRVVDVGGDDATA